MTTCTRHPEHYDFACHDCGLAFASVIAATSDGRVGKLTKALVEAHQELERVKSQQAQDATVMRAALASQEKLAAAMDELRRERASDIVVKIEKYKIVGRLEERAAIVADLRSIAAQRQKSFESSLVFKSMADRYERGDHFKEPTESIRELNQQVVDSEWFKQSYVGGALGDDIDKPTEGE